MKVTIKLIVIACLSVAAAAAALFSKAPATAASEAASPRSLYMQNCARCHGADGKANTATGRRLDADDISGGVSTAKVIRTATNGRGKMPSFRRKLTPAQIRSIASYVASL